ncbi:MAG TPA: hypothetical protein VFQ39_19540 [Longimicrobium sp.]|nr:hypothetical protein [Longimicrobium sp.]
MHRITIQRFRALLVGRDDRGADARAYRELARRPDLARPVAFDGWIPWDVADPSPRAVS